MAKRKSVKKNVKELKPLSLSEETIASQAIAAAYSSASRVIMKVCRLCESKDGPFLNIFGAENMTAKKIDDIMPFVVAENDDLPHKICFRCSAKVEEFYEFIEKCTKTQESLHKALGKNETVTTKVRTRTLWEEKLNESNMSNDDICNALIKKAMEGIKGIPILPVECDVKMETKKNDTTDKDGRCSDEEYTTQANETKKSSLRSRRRQNVNEESPTKQAKLEEENIAKEETKSSKRKDEAKNKEVEEPQKNEEKLKTKSLETNFSMDNDPDDKKEDPKSYFNIMDHVSMIKVNGVGVLFQCKLCNRNFLKKEVVMSHACAKNGGKKLAEEAKPMTPEPPRMPMVKYINTRVQNYTSKAVMNNSPINIDDDSEEDDKPLVQNKPKPRIGPASRVKRTDKSLEPQTSVSTPSCAIANVMGMQSIQQTQKQIVSGSLVVPDPTSSLPLTSHMNSRYKLMPGPNNTFILVEDKLNATEPTPKTPTSELAPNIQISKIASNPKQIKQPIPTVEKSKTSETPYPVGLIKKVSRTSTFPSLPDSLTTPAMKKQSYTVVQTGNPSKLLISTKTEANEKLPTKRLRKTPREESIQKPYSVTLEVNDRPKNSSFFTFVNVDPLLQPSYVLPTDSNIQESQISTSTTAKPVSEEIAKYTCNMCGEKFSREKKLLTHIQCHYSQMDAEDELRAQKNPKKKRSKT